MHRGRGHSLLDVLADDFAKDISCSRSGKLTPCIIEESVLYFEDGCVRVVYQR